MFVEVVLPSFVSCDDPLVENLEVFRVAGALNLGECGWRATLLRRNIN